MTCGNCTNSTIRCKSSFLSNSYLNFIAKFVKSLNDSRNRIFLLFILILTILTTTKLNSQNLQLHYDYGKDRNYLTTTFEMFKPDDYGATFWFIDLDFNQPDTKSISLVYMEICRYFKIPGFDLFSPTIQYNDGAFTGGKLGPAWLAGARRSFDISGVKFNLDLLYRNDYFSDRKDAQITITWHETFFKKLIFTGFIDVWSTGKDKKKIVILTEPQLWLNVWNQLDIGCEIELSRNFISQDKLEYKPTIGIRWNFDRN